MPKRTNPFQKMIKAIYKSLPENLAVSESVEVNEPFGAKREVDVVVEGNMGGQHKRIGIECTDRKRPCSLTWVDQIIGKFKYLDIESVILVSSSGFTSAAKAKASLEGWEAISTIEAEKLDWGKYVGRLGLLISK